MAILDDAIAAVALVTQTRAIGYVIPDVVVEEVARDTTFITQHPVEKGASISDHAFMMPIELEMTCGWSNSTVGFLGYVDAVYLALQTLQQTREPFTVYTPRRAYSNMLIKSLEKTENEQTSNSLYVRVGLQQVIIVSTETTAISNSKATQAQPAKTTSTTTSGTKQLKLASGPISYAGNGG